MLVSTHQNHPKSLGQVLTPSDMPMICPFTFGFWNILWYFTAMNCHKPITLRFPNMFEICSNRRCYSGASSPTSWPLGRWSTPVRSPLTCNGLSIGMQPCWRWVWTLELKKIAENFLRCFFKCILQLPDVLLGTINRECVGRYLYTYAHTHTHIYIYIYIYKYK